MANRQFRDRGDKLLDRLSPGGIPLPLVRLLWLLIPACLFPRATERTHTLTRAHREPHNIGHYASSVLIARKKCTAR